MTDHAAVVEQLLSVFADADPAFVRARVAAVSQQTNDQAAVFDAIISEMVASEYPKKIAELDLTALDPAVAAQQLQDKTKCLEEIKSLFPEVDIRWLETFYDQTMAQKKNGAATAELVGNYLLENPGYPKRPALPKLVPSRSSSAVVDLTGFPSQPSSLSVELGREPTKNYMDTSQPVSELYASTCYILLLNAFPWLSQPVIRDTLSQCKNHYTPAFKKCQEMIGEVPNNYNDIRPPPNPTVKLLKTRRKSTALPPNRDEELFREVEWLKRDEELQRAEKDWALARQMNEKEYTDSGQLIECGCCCGEYPFDDMVQCNDGHLFCRDCLKRYLEETVFGKGQTEVHCMDGSGCKERFPMSQLQRALPPKTFKKLQDRMADLEVRKAGIEGLHQCPFCDYMVEINNPEEKVMQCRNPECKKETCLQCRELSHLPLRCEEVEKKHETDFRKSVEEKMSEALVRVCPKCKARFLKTEGCNKIHCQCGTLLCYVCRETIPPKIGYNHFCSHTRNPMRIHNCIVPFGFGFEPVCLRHDSRAFLLDMGKCDQCHKCYLFLKDTSAEDNKLVEKARAEAEAVAKQQNPDLVQKIHEIGGVASKPKKKKTKVNEAAPYNPLGYHVNVVQQQLQRLFGLLGNGDDDDDSDDDDSDDHEVQFGFPPGVIQAPAPPPPAPPGRRVVARRPYRRRKR